MSETPSDSIIEERIYTIPFGKMIYGRRIPRPKRTPRAVRYLRTFIRRHLRCEDVIIDPEVNEFMWASVMITDAKLKTIQTGLHAFAGEAGVLVDPSVAFAAGAIIVFPVILATFFMQKYMVSGLTAGAVKD